MRTATLTHLFLGMVLITAWNAGPGAAQEFRIETDVFVDDEKEPRVETLTIFDNGVVYDFLLTDVPEITMFDRGRNRLVLMDTKRKVKTELSMDSIVAFIAQMKVSLGDEQRKFLLSETAATSKDDEGWLKVANERVVYRAQCIAPKNESIVQAYQQFADWYARLNAMRGNLPPFLRIQLNSEMAKNGSIPKTVERTIYEKTALSEKKQVVRSQHLANWRLSNTDRKWIDRAGANLATFPTVTFSEYLQLPMAAADTQEKRR